MDELELLKKDWNKKDNYYPKLTYDEIYKMILKKSSSIVKWIFIISLLEFSFGILLLLINPEFESEALVPVWIDTMTYFMLPVIIYFIYRFYKNYKNISVTDNIKTLINNILSTRKIVKYYIIFNLVFAGIASMSTFFVSYTEINGVTFSELNASANFGKLSLLILTALAVTIFILGIIYGIYYLLYGILLKRLKKNYKELKKIDV
jgi:hypothetical protein